VQREEQHKPPRIILYAGAGVGKSSFAASMPDPVLIDWDKGAGEIVVPKLPGPGTWEESLALIRKIAADPGPYKTLAIDTVDPLETMAETFICQRDKKKDIGNYDFGAGYHALAAEWRVLLAELDVARERGMMICLLAHVIVRQVNDPSLGQYDVYASQLQKKTWAESLRWADLVAFASFDASRVADENRSVVMQDRVLYTSRGSGFDAKNRFGMPHKIPFRSPAQGGAWPEVDAWIQRHRTPIEVVRQRIIALAKGTPYEAKAAELAKATDVGELLDTERQLKEKLA
jgi:hypothetical protein